MRRTITVLVSALAALVVAVPAVGGRTLQPAPDGRDVHAAAGIPP